VKRRVLVLLAAILLAAAPARAQRAAIDADLFRPNLSGLGLFQLESPALLAPWRFGAGLWLDYESSPLTLTTNRTLTQTLINARSTATLNLSLGLWRYIEVGFALSVALYNEQRSGFGESMSVTGLGQSRFQLKVRLLTETAHGLGIAFLPVVTFPTGNPNVFLSEQKVTFRGALALERHLFGRLRLLANVGYTFRSPSEFLNLKVGDEIDYGIGVGVRVHDRLELGTELFGATPADHPFAARDVRNPTELHYGARLLLGSNWQVSAGAGHGVGPGYGAPGYRVFAGLTYAPNEPDSDGDGVPDKEDQCPNDPGPKENYGCPGPSRIGDRDLDGVPDNEDRCPTVPGPKENHGCPWGDRDGDGIPDNEDRCPDVPGWRHLQGCRASYEVPGVGLFNTEGAASLPLWHFLFTSSFQYSINPMVLQTENVLDRPQLNARLLAVLTFGLGLPGNTQISVTMPVPIYPDPTHGWQRELAAVTNLTAPQLSFKVPFLNELTKGLGFASSPPSGSPPAARCAASRGSPGSSSRRRSRSRSTSPRCATGPRRRQTRSPAPPPRACRPRRRRSSARATLTRPCPSGSSPTWATPRATRCAWATCGSTTRSSSGSGSGSRCASGSSS
jgi:hypothetical protein